MNRYMVVSYDPDQQQWFYDMVFADNEVSAKNRICREARPYVVDADVLDVPAMERMTRALQTITRVEADAWLVEVSPEVQS